MISLNSLYTFPANQFPSDDIPKVDLGEGGNSYGYLCDEFNIQNRLKILFLGDSWTQGAGVSRVHSYPQIVCEKISQKLGVSAANWNMGHGGKGYDYIARTLLCSLNVLQPDIVFITFPSMDRREFYTLDKKCIDLSVSNLAAIDRADIDPPPLIRDFYENYRAFLSPPDDAARAILIFNLINLLLDKYQIPWGFSSNDWAPAPNIIAELLKFGHIPYEKYLGQNFRVLDQVSDTDGHPAIESHRCYGEEVGEWILNRYAAELEFAASKFRQGGVGK